MSRYHDEIVQFFEAELGLKKGSYQEDELLFSSGRLDSFGLVTLLAFVEERLARRLKTAETTLANFDSIARLDKFMGATA